MRGSFLDLLRPSCFPGGDRLPVEAVVGRLELARLFAAAGFTGGAEVGVWRGLYSETLCRENPALQLLCVDAWAPLPGYGEQKNDAQVLAAAYDEARRRLPNSRCTFIRKPSLEAAAGIPDRSLDFVYIDANHRYDAVLQDLEAWAPKVRAGGVVSGHDYATNLKRHINVERAVLDYTVVRGIAPWFVLRAFPDEYPSFLWVVE